MFLAPIFVSFFKASKVLCALKFVFNHNADAATLFLLRCFLLELLFGSLLVLETDVEDEQHKRAKE